ncbi:DEAD/DEAH box helicase [Patescibacteria group bacterium]|nr:DEAD/DEAH box helicase [Patescibacteria group bacterium]
MNKGINIFALKYWAEKISLKKSAGQLERLSSLLAKSTIDLNPYQIQSAIYAFNSPLARGCIFADEVGLGKTIEAGIVLSQLWLEEKRRILIIVPASLRTQWKEELETHFGLKSTVLDSKYFENQINKGKKTPFTYDSIYICSLPFLYKRMPLVKKQPWNLVVVDEAHRLRRVYKGKDASKMAFALREAIEDKPKLLLTATPLQNSLLELYGLASFIDNKLLGNIYHFKTRFIDKINENPSLKNETLKILRNLVIGDAQDNFSPTGIVTRTLRRQVKEYVNFPPRNSLTQDFTPTQDEQKLYEQVSTYLQRKNIASIESTQRNLMILVYRKLLASSSFAIAPTLKKLYERLEYEISLRKKELKEETSIDFDEESLSVEEVEINESKISRGRVSSSFSDNEIIEEINELKKYYNLAKSITHNTKGEALIKSTLKVLKIAKKRNWPQKIVVFTESTRTQKYLQKILNKANVGFVPFSGHNVSEHSAKAYDKWKKEFPESAIQYSKQIAIRQALVYEFRSNPNKKVFLTTEAGSEGLNLQFANLLINYDLPWNPQRIEQRIGRVHRYGQKYEVIIANLLNTKNYADKRVLELLTEKLGLFNGLFGASDEILGNIEAEIEFEQRILDIYQNCKTPEEIDKAFQQLQQNLKASVSTDIQKTKSLILEQFDSPVSKLFKQTQIDVNQTLNEYDSALLRLCQEYYKDKFAYLEKSNIAQIMLDGKKKKFLFREEKENEKGKISRVHNDHPLIKKILDETLKISTNPIPTIKINIQQLGKQKQKILKYHNGVIYVFKLQISAVEEDEILAPLAFVKANGNFLPLDVETSKILVEANSEILSKTVNKSPLEKKELYNHWNKWKTNILKKYQNRNEKLYIREMDRINRYWDNYSLKTKDSIDKVKNELEEIKRKREKTLDFQEKRGFDQKIQKKQLRLRQLNTILIKEEEEALKQQMKEIETLNGKLELRQSEELIAITVFNLYE